MAREAERIAAIAPPHKDAMVGQENDGRQEDADDGEAEGRDTDSSINFFHYHKREKERHGGMKKRDTEGWMQAQKDETNIIEWRR